MTKRKNPAAVALGRKGGKARARILTPAERSESCRQASLARWAQVRKRIATLDKAVKSA